jgi:hypothetical protein
MTDRPPAPDLTSDLDHWEITLNSGEILRVRAHAYGEEEGWYIFVALMRGTPNYEYELLRVPTSAVTNVEGGWLSPRAGGSA